MTNAQTMDAPRSVKLIDAAIAEHGAWRVAFAALLQALTPRPRPVPAHLLSDRMRKDIGYYAEYRISKPWEHML